MMYTFIILASIFLFGLAIGSFLNVVIYRTLHDESPLEGRSHCPKCKKTIRATDNIPLVSYLLLRGHCRFCRGKISLTYPVVEFLTGLLFVWWYLTGSLFFHLTQSPFVTIQPFFWLVVALILLSIFFADLTYGLIPDVLVVILAFMAFGYRLLLTAGGIMQVGDFWLSVASAFGAGLFFLALILITRKKGMGLGDLKLVFALGLLLGWPRILVALILSFVLGATVSVGLLFFRVKKLGQTVPFGPFLIIGTAISLIWGQQIWMWYLKLLF